MPGGVFLCWVICGVGKQSLLHGEERGDKTGRSQVLGGRMGTVLSPWSGESDGTHKQVQCWLGRGFRWPHCLARMKADRVSLLSVGR